MGEGVKLCVSGGWSSVALTGTAISLSLGEAGRRCSSLPGSLWTRREANQCVGERQGKQSALSYPSLLTVDEKTNTFISTAAGIKYLAGFARANTSTMDGLMIRQSVRSSELYLDKSLCLWGK